MPTFHYKAIDKSKKIKEGSITAKTREEAAQILNKQESTPLVIQLVQDSVRIRGKIPLVDKITFCRYLATTMKSGISLSEGIDVLKDETKHPLMKKILGDMNYSLEQGQQLSTIFERYPDVFEPYFLTLIKAGEISGKLADIFDYLELELRSEYSLNSKVKGAFLYPGIVFTAMIGIGIMMFFFVLPQIGKVFLNLNLPLHPITRTLFQSSIVMSKHMILIFILGIFAVIGAFLAFQKPIVKRLLLHMIRPVPFVRNLIQKVDLARFNRIFATLTKSAVPITEASEIALKTLTWHEYRNLASVVPDELRKGDSFTNVMKKHKVFPTLMIQMLSAGEKTGTLDKALADLATFYEQEVEEEVKSLTQIIEPVLMLLVGAGVGAMILSIIAPIYSVVGSFQEMGR
ncbi:type II secretion system F family protein [Patescibacteria group bacterium]